MPSAENTRPASKDICTNGRDASLPGVSKGKLPRGTRRRNKIVSGFLNSQIRPKSRNFCRSWILRRCQGMRRYCIFVCLISTFFNLKISWTFLIWGFWFLTWGWLRLCNVGRVAHVANDCWLLHGFDAYACRLERAFKGEESHWIFSDLDKRNTVGCMNGLPQRKACLVIQTMTLAYWPPFTRKALFQIHRRRDSIYIYIYSKHIIYKQYDTVCTSCVHGMYRDMLESRCQTD